MTLGLIEPLCILLISDMDLYIRTVEGAMIYTPFRELHVHPQHGFTIHNPFNLILNNPNPLFRNTQNMGDPIYRHASIYTFMYVGAMFVGH